MEVISPRWGRAIVRIVVLGDETMEVVVEVLRQVDLEELVITGGPRPDAFGRRAADRCLDPPGPCGSERDHFGRNSLQYCGHHLHLFRAGRQ